MEQAYYIRNKYRREDKSFRQIARETKHDFTTVKKYVEMEERISETQQRRLTITVPKT